MNRGIDLAREQAEQDGTEWKFGAAARICLAAIPLIVREKYQPIGELQFGKEDYMDCATRAPINILAAKFTYRYRLQQFLAENRQWLEDNGYVKANIRNELDIDFSDRFIAILSGTTREGNSFKSPLETIRKCGLIPKEMLPHVGMTFDEYHDKACITTRMFDLGKEFARRFTINYEQVSDIKSALNLDEIEVGGFAWPPEVNGVFGRIDTPMNHAFKVIAPEYTAFDNYTDQDGDFLKKLAADYKFYPYGYRVMLTAETGDPVIAQKQSIIALILQFLGLRRLAESLKPVTATSSAPVIPVQNAPETTPELKPIQSPSSRLYDLAFASQGQDLSKNAPNERGCAESLSRLINQIDPGFPILISTAAMMPYLRKRYREVTVPEPGDIAIFPTTNGVTGHCGVWGKNHVMSNTSATGKFEANYSFPDWLAVAKRRGLPNYFFRMVEH